MRLRLFFLRWVNVFLDTPRLTCKFSSNTFLPWVLRISYTAGTIVLFKLGAVSASGEIGNVFFILHVVACIIKVFLYFWGTGLLQRAAGKLQFLFLFSVVACGLYLYLHCYMYLFLFFAHFRSLVVV